MLPPPFGLKMELQIDTENKAVATNTQKSLSLSHGQPEGDLTWRGAEPTEVGETEWGILKGFWKAGYRYPFFKKGGKKDSCFLGDIMQKRRWFSLSSP